MSTLQNDLLLPQLKSYTNRTEELIRDYATCALTGQASDALRNYTELCDKISAIGIRKLPQEFRKYRDTIDEQLFGRSAESIAQSVIEHHLQRPDTINTHRLAKLKYIAFNDNMRISTHPSSGAEAAYADIMTEHLRTLAAGESPLTPAAQSVLAAVDAQLQDTGKLAAEIEAESEAAKTARAAEKKQPAQSIIDSKKPPVTFQDQIQAMKEAQNKQSSRG